MSNHKKGNWLIVVSIILALILTLIPFPDSLQSARPSWVFLVLAYWTISFPERVGLLWAIGCGIALDGLLGSTLGVHVFVLAIESFLLLVLYKRIRIFPLWKQGLMISGLSVIYVVLSYSLLEITSAAEQSVQWLSVIVNGLIWPVIFIVIRNARNYFKVQ